MKKKKRKRVRKVINLKVINLKGGKDGSAFKAWKWKWAESSYFACCQGEPGAADGDKLNDDNDNAGEPGAADVEL